MNGKNPNKPKPLNISIEGYRVTDVVTEYLEYFLRYFKSINIAVLKLLKFLIQRYYNKAFNNVD